MEITIESTLTVLPIVLLLLILIVVHCRESKPAKSIVSEGECDLRRGLLIVKSRRIGNKLFDERDWCWLSLGLRDLPCWED